LVFAANGDFDVLAVELSASSCTGRPRLAPQAGAMLNLADDHLDWHGDFDAYASRRPPCGGPRRHRRGQPRRPPGGRGAVAGTRPARCVTLGEPGPGELGVVAGRLTDRAFGDGVDLGPADGIRPAGAHNVSNALHAAALARAYGVDAAAVAAGLAGYTPEPHRNALVCTVDGVGFVDDSKATNPHAALASLSAYPRIVWVAGGQLKGVDIDDLVASVADRLVGAVLLGVDRSNLATRSRDTHRTCASSRSTGPMMAHWGRSCAPRRNWRSRATPCSWLRPPASLDMFTSYAHRGERFAAEVRVRPSRQASRGARGGGRWSSGVHSVT
jgi:UDP-N-acetylmuramoylalanine--D-glutamate ligase